MGCSLEMKGERIVKGTSFGHGAHLASPVGDGKWVLFLMVVTGSARLKATVQSMENLEPEPLDQTYPNWQGTKVVAKSGRNQK